MVALAALASSAPPYVCAHGHSVRRVELLRSYGVQLVADQGRCARELLSHRSFAHNWRLSGADRQFPGVRASGVVAHVERCSHANKRSEFVTRSISTKDHCCLALSEVKDVRQATAAPHRVHSGGELSELLRHLKLGVSCDDIVGGHANLGAGQGAPAFVVDEQAAERCSNLVIIPWQENEPDTERPEQELFPATWSGSAQLSPPVGQVGLIRRPCKRRGRAAMCECSGFASRPLKNPAGVGSRYGPSTQNQC
mmetsp:Transcript_9636/g.27811  ORF Transcript_9636/g.27811 Transcript_9636/m.27811 type:complete len:253 (-) Transcript_9636:876-1634(-)